MTAAELENGWRFTTPPGDNLLLDFARAEAEGYAAIAREAGGRTAVDEDLGLHMNDAGSLSPFGNVAHLVKPVGQADTERMVTAMREFFGAATGGPFLLYSPWPTADLTRHGFLLGGHPPFMVRPPGALSAGTRAPIDGVVIKPARTPADVAVFERTLVEGYPAPELSPFGSQPPLFGDGIVATQWRLFIAYYLGGEPVGTAAAFVHHGVVAVEAISTIEGRRGRGYGAALAAAAMVAEPRLPAALLSSDPGRGVYESLGFLPVSRHTLWVGRR